MTKTPSVEILIAEDDQLITTLLKRQLGKLLSSPIKTFWNGKELLGYIQETYKETESFLILLDIHMPLMDGWEVLEEINRFYSEKKIFVLMLTSSLNPDDRTKAFSYPQVIGFKDKFLDREDFEAILQHESLKNILQTEMLSEK